MFKNIHTILEKLVDKNVEKDLLEYKRLKRKWAEKINKKTQKNAKIIDFTKGTIIIKTKNAAWKNEIVFMQNEIKKKFQTQKTQLKKS